MTSYKLQMPKATFYGAGALQHLGAEAKGLGDKVLIISDRMMEKLGYVRKCEEYLECSGLAHVKYLDISSEPTDIFVYEALELLKQENCDVLVAVGGGSCIDTAKAVSILATNGAVISDYMNNKRVAEKRGIPIIAIPTTAGTGSEATDVTVITNTKTDTKMMIKQPAFLPEKAIVDPELTLSSPQGVTSATGIDALTHAIEAYLSRQHQPYTDQIALSAIKVIMENIESAYSNGEDIRAREGMAYGAMLAGMAFSNSSVCLVHGMSRPIGALFHVPHGISNAMLLPIVLTYSQEGCIDRLAGISRFLYEDLKGLSKFELAEKFVHDVKKLCFALDIPSLKAWGINEKSFYGSLDKMASDAIDSGSPANNPKVPTKEDIMNLYKEAYHYVFESKAYLKH
ncbi:alcohol dehydrogenase [Scopulibacillus darangshiensis]|uniref:Alcohol dehydrogenase n=1 Tax=Scopulibacillus darangshiensis TaxID=442528 RepID=A0A4R2PAG4_9BACL|nr:iron-containing alcohol dehydrogenase [Scopulibacillus darangshiensis]TCP31264.1 alcohol dehydrogenase [Scopulibacillus darangshiensis]